MLDAGGDMFDGMTNLALESITFQVSQWSWASPDRAVDGNQDSNLPAGSCSSTHYTPQAWFAIDLSSVHQITGFRITNRGDAG